jgi:pyrroloquinoline quinone biosynthesis protein B
VADGNWLLVNASPDLPQQIESFPSLQPTSNRESRIAAVFLTNADIDHVLGLVLLRQHEQPLTVFSTPAIRDELRWVDNVLARFSEIDWRDPPERFEQLAIEMVDLGRSVCWLFRNTETNKSVLVAPAAQAITRELTDAMDRCDLVLFDGTFWSDDELKPYRRGARTAREMGHVPVQESLNALRKLAAQKTVYIHINNTNPMIQPDSDERKLIADAGILVGADGMDLEL